MALTRKFLSALGIDADKVDEIINAHTETVDALKNERDKYKADAEKLPEVQKELDGMKEEAAKNDGKNPFEVKYNAIKEEFENYKKEQTAKETKVKKADAYKALLKEAGVSEKRIDAVLRVSDIDGLKLDKDGAVEGKDALLESIKKDWSDFIVTQGTQGAKTPNPPANGGGKTYKSKEEIYAIKDTAERQKAIYENRELFGI
jgi:hypothetical protein